MWWMRHTTGGMVVRSDGADALVRRHQYRFPKLPNLSTLSPCFGQTGLESWDRAKVDKSRYGSIQRANLPAAHLRLTLD
jgi:hypothetical protein